MAFRDKPREDGSKPPASRKAWRKGLMQERVERGGQVGFLAYDDGAPIGWCSAGPLAQFRRLGGPAVEEPHRVWAISCFFIARPYRGQGVMRGLVESVIGAAQAAGAGVLQATPVMPEAAGYRFMGFVPLFRSLGFEEIALAGHSRHVMRYFLQPVTTPNG